MRPASITIYLAMLFSSEIWAVYGVGLVGRDANESNCTSCTVQTPSTTRTSTLPPRTSPFQTPLPASRHTTSLAPSLSTPNPQPSNGTLTSSVIPTTHSPNNILHTAPTSDKPYTNTFANLSTGAKAGIIAGVSIFFLGVFLILFELGYLRRKRRERALQRAIEEVERGGGMEMRKRVGSEQSESKENMVLESRVEIVVVDDDEEEEESDGDDVWNVGMEDDERWRGRQAMSLPRREY
ncbi:Nn.00g094450.m01.CDS01 [Neocucurbitaria sp. VM-36]